MTEWRALGEFAGQGLAVWRGGRLVFRGLGFVLPPSGVLQLVGPNGSGKSTLLRVLAGLLPPAAGRVLWNGAEVDRGTHLARLAYLGHGDAVKPGLSVAEHLVWHGRLHGVSVAVEPALAATGIAGLARLPARTLSAGQRRRLALARLVAVPKPVWLLDEPTTALDRDGTALFADLVQSHLASGGRVLAATHLDLGVTGDSLTVADFVPHREEEADEPPADPLDQEAVA
ncbi:MAG: heme ABC exporter ATP-binding protein CcmA [Alphaproteobacteria bacterium]|nr:heme ABC exporter ATP-binding protein CcmA [Alphaproteobacteria bacterium]